MWRKFTSGSTGRPTDTFFDRASYFDLLCLSLKKAVVAAGVGYGSRDILAINVTSGMEQRFEVYADRSKRLA